jgi:hypothetical protein
MPGSIGSSMMEPPSRGDRAPVCQTLVRRLIPLTQVVSGISHLVSFASATAHRFSVEDVEASNALYYARHTNIATIFLRTASLLLRNPVV